MALPEYEKRVNKLKELEKTNIYSTEETVVGSFKETDGTQKNVYRKYTETEITATGNRVLHNSGSMDKMFYINVHKKTSGNHEPFTDWWSVRSNGTIVGSITTTGTYACTVVYTKTTD